MSNTEHTESPPIDADAIQDELIAQVRLLSPEGARDLLRLAKVIVAAEQRLMPRPRDAEGQS